MNPQIIFLGVVVVLLVVFMLRNSRKRSRDAATLASTLQPGAEIMTSGGIFGTVESIDEDENKIVLQTGPTSHLTIHRQAVGRVVTPAPTTEESTSTGAVLNGEPVIDPAYGERVEPEATDGATARGAERDAR